MNYIYNFSILAFIFSIALSQVQSLNKNIPLDKDSDIIKWDEETKKIKNPELQRLLNELKQEFIKEKEILHNNFKDKVKLLKKDYSSKRKALIKEYRKKNKNTLKDKPIKEESDNEYDANQKDDKQINHRQSK